MTRTVLQTADLIQAFPLTDAQRTTIGEISYKVMENLIACLDAFERIRDQVREGQAKVDAGEIRIQAGGQVIDLPSVPNLRKDVEAFLYNAKLALRDTAELFEVFYDQRFGIRYDRAQRWTAETFGAGSGLAVMLAENASWIERLIRLRNAVEHPRTEPGGALQVVDFSLRQDGQGLFVIEPVWSQGDHEGALVPEMEILQHNLLTLFEDLLATALVGLESPFTIYEIPEKDRDPDIPKRLAVTLRKPISVAELESDSE